MEIKRFVEGLLEANCYIITGSSDDCYIIDPGYNPKKLLKYIKKENLNVKGIILTHHHYDHSGAVDGICHEIDCPVMIHRMDADMLKRYGDVFLEDGDVVQLDEEKMHIMHTPGHTRGGICIYCPKAKVCFTGDTIFNVDLGRTDLEDGSQKEMEDSIRNVIDKWGNDITIYPGHGDPATMKKVRKINKEYLEIINGN